METLTPEQFEQAKREFAERWGGSVAAEGYGNARFDFSAQLLSDLTALLEQHKEMVLPSPSSATAEEKEAEIIVDEWFHEYCEGRVERNEMIATIKSFAALAVAEATKDNKLQQLMNDISEWSDKSFGNGQRNPAIVYHLKKEVDELIEAINRAHRLGSDPSVGVGEYGRQLKNTRTEYADCMMLLLDSALHFGISAKELLSLTRDKLEINKARKWGKPDENGVVEHIKE